MAALRAGASRSEIPMPVEMFPLIVIPPYMMHLMFVFCCWRAI